MANILIDGYNMMGVHHRDINKAREEFIELLDNYAMLGGHKVIVVFDGYKGIFMKEQVTQQGIVRIVFTPVGQRADDYIVDFVRVTNSEWIVVTSDRAIVSEVWRTRSIPIGVGPFWEILLEPQLEGIRDIAEHIVEHIGGRTLSARQKRALTKALSRL